MSSIYDLVAATFSELGMSARDEVWETLFIEDGCFVGHKFHCDRGYAIWASGWGAVEVFDEHGKLLKKVAVKKPLRSSA